MIPQVHNDRIWYEEQTPPPVDQKQKSTSASSWRGWSRLLRVLGVVVPFVGGFTLSFPNPLPLSVYLLEPILLGIVAAGLLRSWWAMLVVPVALSVGFFLGNIFQMGGFDLHGWAASGFEGVDILVILGVVPVAIGVAIGIPFGKKIEQRLQR
jgi:hypothetical protein